MENNAIDTSKLVENSNKSYQKKAQKNFVDLCWANPDKKDNLVIKDSQPFKDVMEARAKGTRVYELIDLYGSPQNVATAFPEKAGAQYGDFSDVPDVFNQEAVDRIQAKLNAQLEEAIKEELAKQQLQPSNGDAGQTGDDSNGGESK